MAQGILAIDVGSYSIKLVKAERSFGEFTIQEFHEISLSGYDVLTREQTTTALLHRFLEEHPVSYDTAVTSISGLQTAVRLIEFPFTQVSKVDSALEFELENYVPMPIEDLWTDYVLLDKAEKSSRVLSVYTPKADLVKFLGMLSQGGVDPRSVGAEVFDLANLYHSGLLPPQGNYVILDLGHSKTNVCVMQGSRLRMARTISVGGKTITQAIAKAFHLGLNSAEEMKIKQGQVSPFDTADQLSEVIQGVLENLLVQIRQTLFSFYEKGEKMIEAVYLCGGTSRLPGIDQYISTRLRLNVSPLDVLDGSYSQLPDPEGVRPIIAQCMAQVFRVVYPSKTVPLNLRHGEFAYKRDLEALSGQLRSLGWMSVFVLVLGILYFSTSLYVLGGREEKLNSGVVSLLKQGLGSSPKTIASAQAALAVATTKINETNEQLKKLEGGGTTSVFEVFRLISANLPPRTEVRLDIDELNLSDDHAKMKGRTDSYDSLQKIKDSMEKMPLFKNVQTSDVGKGAQDEIRFSLFFDIGGEIGKGK